MINIKMVLLTLFLSFFIIGTLTDSSTAQKDNNTVQVFENKASNLPGNVEYIPGEVLVKFKSGTDDKAVFDLTSRHNVKSIEKVLKKYQSSNGKSKVDILEKYGLDRLEILKISEDANIDEVVREINNHSIVEYAEPNYIVHTYLTPDDPQFSSLWGLHNTGQNGGTSDADIDAPEAWDIQTGTSQVVIAVIDTGVYYSHPDLAANIWTNPGEIAGNGIDDDGNGYIDDVNGYDFANGDGDPADDNSHGTHVAGTIGAVGNDNYGIAGVNWNVKIMPIKFLNSAGSGSTTNAISAIEYATMMNANIMSNSWGGSGYSSAMRDAISAANDKGILFVAAAGNSGQNNDASPQYPSSYNIPNVIAVAATDGNDRLASFSNYGAASVDLGAPGVSIYSTVLYNGYGYKTGTSMATPHVSGVAGLIKGQFPAYSSNEIKAQMLSAVDPIPSLYGKTVTGGRLNARKALEPATPNTPPVAFDRSVTTDEDTPVTATLSATDSDGDLLTYSIVSSPLHGSLSGSPPGVTYAPTANYNGADSFTFRANDGKANSNTATVSINVNATNDRPVANDRSATTSENTQVAITLSATDPDGDPLIYSILSSPSHGSISGTPPDVTYTPSANYNGTDSFTFLANDGTADSNIATVSITVMPRVLETIEFSDSFENSLVNWTQDSQNDWFVSNQRRTLGSYSAEVDGSATDATLTLKNSINLSGKTGANLSFSWFIEGNWDTGEYIKVDIFNGSSWINVASIAGTSGTNSGSDENHWINRDISLSSYMVQNFKLRLRATVSSNLEDGNIDNVKIIARV